MLACWQAFQVQTNSVRIDVAPAWIGNEHVRTEGLTRARQAPGFPGVLASSEASGMLSKSPLLACREALPSINGYRK